MVRPKEHNRDKIALDLIAWSKKASSVNLNEFCAINDLPPSKLSLFAKENDCFRQAYELAKCHLAYRREDMLNRDKLHVKAYDLNATVYDYFLREEKRLQTEFEHHLKLQEQKIVSEEQQTSYDAIMAMLDRYQSSRTIADSSNNNA